MSTEAKTVKILSRVLALMLLTGTVSFCVHDVLSYDGVLKPNPRSGELWESLEHNPFKTKQCRIIEVRQGFVLYDNNSCRMSDSLYTFRKWHEPVK